MSDKIKDFQSKPTHKQWEGYHASHNPVFLGSVPSHQNTGEMCDLYITPPASNHTPDEFEIALLSQRNGSATFDVMRNESLKGINCDQISEAIKKPEGLESLDNYHQAICLAIIEGHLPEPKEYLFGNSYIKDREYKLSLSGSDDSTTFYKLPDFYVFENEKEAEKYCAPGTGIYTKANAIGLHHLQSIAHSLRLDSELEKQRVAMSDEKDQKFKKYCDSVMSQYVTSHKNDVISKIKENANALYAEPDSLRPFIESKVKLLASKPKLVESLMGSSVLSSAGRGYIEENHPDSLPLSLRPHEVSDLIENDDRMKAIGSIIVVELSFKIGSCIKEMNLNQEAVEDWLANPENAASVVKKLVAQSAPKAEYDSLSIG